MILYLLQSGICLLVLFGAYKLVLENEKMHRFNRFYLLASILFSFLTPLVPVDLFPKSMLVPALKSVPEIPLQSFKPASSELIEHEQPGITIPVFSILYGLITGFLLLRFIRNVWFLCASIKSNEKRPFEGATLVLKRSITAPYTFLRYIFINKELYDQNQIEPELLTHELTHVQQRHSLDVIGIEFLLVFVWFNPVLYWLKTAIKLNHEFLADDAVNSRYRQITAYQRLILSKVTKQPTQNLSSLLTFQTTKRRFLMMTKQTSFTKAVILQFSMLLVVSTLLGLSSIDTSAQDAKPASPAPKKTDPVVPDLSLEERYKNIQVIGWVNKEMRGKKYSELTPEEKKHVIELPPEPRKSPTDAQFNDWKNPDKFGIWLDGKRIKNEELNKYKPSDIVSFWGSYVHKNARRFGKHHYQFELMTEKYYSAYLKIPILVFDEEVKREVKK
ncbi:M56 family metallopeptidase [Larkinella sp. VNQ87]|uniref:M56 family metallopeptidase n=1 Tax=Larkinella sp. VNQ87 TaxID=3400921 RepID=UPI003C09692A